MTMQVSRQWATPLTMGAFVLMAGTGVLMFFHLDNSAQKVLHEWLGWLMVAAVVLHAVANGFAFKRHLVPTGRGTAIAAAFVLVLAGSFAARGGSEGPSPPGLAINAITRAPIAAVAPLFGKSAAQARADLASAGIVLADDTTSLVTALGGDREKTGRALRVLAGAAK